MSQRLQDDDALRRVVDDLAYHQSRVLLLVVAVADRADHQRKLDGLTKLAKLDFLVRYPALAPHILDKLRDDDRRLHLSDGDKDEPTSVEAPMIRYKYGPWDDRYYPVIGSLVSRGLLRYSRGRRGSVALVPTPLGRALNGDLAADPVWRPVVDRCRAVAEASAGMTGSQLKTMIYERVAHLMNRPHREVIA